MKTFAALILAVLIASCASKNNPLAPNNPNDSTANFKPYFICKINDTVFTASVTAYVVGDVWNGHIVSAAGRLGTDSIVINISSVKDGTGDVGFASGYIYFTDPKVQQFYKYDNATVGTFNVSDTTMHFTGTFSFTCTPNSHNAGTHRVTDGKFSVR